MTRSNTWDILVYVPKHPRHKLYLIFKIEIKIIFLNLCIDHLCISYSKSIVSLIFFLCRACVFIVHFHTSYENFFKEKNSKNNYISSIKQILCNKRRCMTKLIRCSVKTDSISNTLINFDRCLQFSII